MATKQGTLTRKEIAQAIAAAFDKPVNYVDPIVDHALRVISDAIKGGRKVELRGFGVFDTKIRKARTARNPATGAAVPVPARRVVLFKAGLDLREALNAPGAVLDLKA